MGMYNYLKCKYPLPRPEMQNRIFQTKSTPDLFLDTYVITADGKLQGPKYDLVWKMDKGSPLGMTFERKNLEMHEMDFSGLLVFYDFETGSYTDSDLIYFEALFDRGKLLWIRERGSD